MRDDLFGVTVKKIIPVLARRVLSLQEVEAPGISRQPAYECGRDVEMTPRGYLWYRYRLSRRQSHSAAGRIKSMRNPNDHFGNRNPLPSGLLSSASTKCAPLSSRSDTLPHMPSWSSWGQTLHSLFTIRPVASRANRASVSLSGCQATWVRR